MSNPAELPSPPLHPQKLHCLGGAEAPPGIGADLQILMRLPESARASIWEALGPSLVEPLPADLEARLDRFCGAHGASGSDLARALKASRFLVREASALDLSRALFAEDLAALSGGPDVGALLLPGYETAKAFVRRDIVRRALADHGKLLVDVEWRVDTITASGHGAKLRAPVAILTLQVQEGERQERVTLQVLPSTLEQLRKICDQILT